MNTSEANPHALDLTIYEKLLEALADEGTDLSTRFIASICMVFYWFF